jgi:hypothetical protein
VSVHCRICRTATLDLVYSFGELPVAGYLESSESAALRAPRLPLALGICRNCGLLQQKYDEANGFLTNVVYSNYQATYSISQRVSTYLARFAETAVEKAQLGKQDPVVEIGCNDGMLLHLFRELGHRSVGYEPSSNFSKQLAGAGVHVIQDYFSTATCQKFLADFPKARLVIARHTLEHAFDPVDFLVAMAAILDEHGLVAIEVPYLVSQIANNHYSSMTFQHTMVFTVGSLCRALECAALRAVDVEFVDTDGGSMVIYAAHNHAKANSQRIDSVRLLEQHLHYHVPEGFDSFFRAVDRERGLVRDLLGEYQRKGECVAAYGAGGKGQSLINMLHCDVDQITFAVDSTVTERRYIPGTRIPVINRSDSAADSATLFFITAPTHGREIIEKERRLAGSKRKFLLISPHLHLQ